MWDPGDGPVGRARQRVAADLRSDPYLPYLLALALVLTGFRFWHLLPNFATRDEMSRLLDPMAAFGAVLADPGVESLRAGVEWGRVPFGATFYLFGLALLPAVVIAALVGALDAFLAFRNPDPEFGYWAVWHGTPEWIWTTTLAFVRLFNVLFAVGAVYLTYRIGVELRDRATGRLAALVVMVTFGFLTIAHEGGEDMPALFFTLLALHSLLGYLRTGEARRFLAASAAGGVAVAFKLTAAPVVGLVALAYLLRGTTAADPRAALLRPRLVAGGAALGLAAIVLGFPTLLVGGVDLFLERVFEGSVSRTNHPTGPDAPIWWWFLRGYFQAFGLPLFVGVVAGALASVAEAAGAVARRGRLQSTVRRPAAVALVAATVAGYVLMFSTWHDFRVHHLLPTFPLLAALLALALVRLRARAPELGRVAIALLLVSGGVYAGAGDLGYASQPRDEATAWLASEAGDDATVEVYRRHMQDAAIPHGMDVNHAFGREGDDETLEPCPEYVELGYRDLLYLKEGTYYRNGRAQAEYLRGLLNGEYGYEIAAEFGPRPPGFVPDRPTPGSLADLAAVGIDPFTDQYADEQELRQNQYTVILERTGDCDESRAPPFALGA